MAHYGIRRSGGRQTVKITNGPKGHLLLGIRNTVFQVHPEKNQVVRAFHVEKLLAETARMTPNESHLVALDAHRNVHVWDMATARYLGRIGKIGEGITCFALAPQGSRIALGRTDATITRASPLPKQWKTGAFRAVHPGHIRLSDIARFGFGGSSEPGSSCPKEGDRRDESS